MPILVDSQTKIIIQGITGTQASFHARRSLDYGTKIVGGVTPGKGGTIHLGLPVYDTVREAKKETGATVSIMFVPAQAVKSAVVEAVEAELDLLVCISDGVPIRDMLEVKSILSDSKTKLIGPNTPGLIVPEVARLGIFPESIHKKGNIGIVSRSSTLTYEAVLETKKAGLGQSAVLGLGDDMLIGMDFVEILERFHEDEQTEAIVMIGQLGGTFEEMASEWYKNRRNKKPIIGFVAGNSQISNRKIGYAGDIIARGVITSEDKERVMRDSGMIMVDGINKIHQELTKLK